MSTLLQIDQSINLEKISWLQVNAANETCELVAIWLIAETMSFAWARRKARADICLRMFLNDLNQKLSFLLRTVHHHNAGVILQDIIAHAPI